jgi:hypothetical protein
VSSLLTRRVGGLPCLHLLQHGRLLLVVDDRAGLHCLDLIEYLKTECRSVELNREPPIRVVHYLHLLAHQGIRAEGKSLLFRSAVGKTGQLSDKPMNRVDAYRMIRRRTAKAGGLFRSLAEPWADPSPAPGADDCRAWRPGRRGA